MGRQFALKTALPHYLREEQRRIEGHAKAMGLDFYTTLFEILPYDQMNEVASYGGFPTRYPHWRFGMEYEQLSKSYEYGASKIYEMVINNNPSFAYLLEGNSLVDQKMVMCHVCGHVDFFKHNPPGAGDVTKVAVDLTQLDALGTACKSLATALHAETAQHADIIWRVQAETRKRETRDEKRTMNKFQYHLWDLGAFASGLAAATDASPAVRAAAGEIGRALAPGAGSSG